METALFQTHVWTPSPLDLKTVPASPEESAVMGSRYGLLVEVRFFFVEFLDIGPEKFRTFFELFLTFSGIDSLA